MLEHPDRMAPVLFGLVEREVGCPHQGRRVGSIPGTQGDADAGADDRHMTVNQVGAAQQVNQARAQEFRRRARRHRHRELVASQPAHHVAVAHGGPQPPRHGLQEGVADRVAVAVVHRLETVEVNHQHRNLVRLVGSDEHRVHARAEPLAVGQAGEAVGPLGRHARGLDGQGRKLTAIGHAADSDVQHPPIR